MTFFEELWANRILLCAVSAYFVAQLIKMLIALKLEKKINWRLLIFGMGGMPSSHTSFVVALALMTGIREGFATTAFALAFALSAIVITDAMGVRAETGKQGAVLNQILREFLLGGKPITEEKLKELVGHSPLEVLGGILVGTIMVIIMA